VADEETKPKRKAKDNPWYRLATPHGEQSERDDDESPGKTELPGTAGWLPGTPGAVQYANITSRPPIVT
jgi:hypothetical protein